MSFVVRVLSEQFFFKTVDAFLVAVSVQFSTFFHRGERSPALRIDDVRILEGFRHVVGLCEGSAGSRSVLLRYFFDVFHYVVSFRMSQDYVHAETCHQSDNTLRNGQRLAV